MSADNCYLIRRINGWFTVTFEYGADENLSKIKHNKWFKSLELAKVYASKQYPAYAVRLSKEIEDED